MDEPSLSELKKFLKNIVINKYGLFSFDKKYPKEYKCIREFTNFLQEDSTIKERVYCILNDILTRPLCNICDNFVNFNRLVPDYNNHCSITCHNKNPETKKKSKETCMKNFGVEHTFQSKEIRDKGKETCLERYGVENVFQVEEFKEKQRKSLFDN